MSQEILDKLKELKAGQESLEGSLSRRLDEIQNELKAHREHDLPLVMDAISAVKETATGNSAGIARLARLLEVVAGTEDSGPRAATG